MGDGDPADMSKWERWRSDLRALKRGPVRRLVAADFASMIGDTMVWAAIAFAVLAVGGSGLQIGLALAVQSAGWALTLLVGGVYADRYSQRSVMVGADLLRFGSQAVIAWLLLTDSASYGSLLVAQAIHGFGSGFYTPASSSIVPAVAPGAEQPTNSLKGVAKSVATFAGPALGAGAVHVAGPGLAMAADAATFLLSAVLLVGLPRWQPKREPDHESSSMIAELREGWGEFLQLRWMRTVTLQWTVINALVIAPLSVFGPEHGVDSWAALLSSVAAGEIVGGAFVMSWRPARPLIPATAGATLYAAPLIALAVNAPDFVTILAGVAAGIGAVTFVVLWETTVQLHTAEAQRSRLIAVEQFGSIVGVPFGFLIGGIAGEAIGPEWGLLGSAAILIVSAGLVLSRSSVRELRADARPIPPAPERAPAASG